MTARKVKEAVNDNLKAYAAVSINWGMVSIPVKIYSPFDDQTLHFNMVHQECTTKLQQGAMWCPECERGVNPNEIVKGYEYEPGKFVTFTADETSKVESTKAIALQQFVPVGSIHLIYYASHYYLAPELGAEEAFSLLAERLSIMSLLAVGEYATRGRGYSVAISSNGTAMVLHHLNYLPSIRNYNRTGYAGYKVGYKTKHSKEAVEMATELINRHASGIFNPEYYTDTVREETLSLIREKIAGRQGGSSSPAKKKPAAKIYLLEQLKASLPPTKKR
jgi:DNA end-binding protein Ku